MSYIGIGNNQSRSYLQKLCIKWFGMNDHDINRWVFDNAKRPISITYYQWIDLSPRIYIIHKNFIIKKGSLINATIACLDKLLNRGEQVLARWSINKSYGHIFNTGKLYNSDIIWYIDPQENINPGKIKLIDKLIRVQEINNKSKYYLKDIGILITPIQKSKLIDTEYGYETDMLYFK